MYRGNIEKAYRICVDAIHDISKKKYIFNSSDTLTRQLYLLTKDKDIIIDINKTSTTTDLFEMFQNKRRLFQFYLQMNDSKNATELQKELETIIRLLGKKLDKIYVGMYYKDMAKYYFLTKEYDLSKSYFKRAMSLFNSFKFEGQKKMLLLDNEQYRYEIIDT